MNKEEIKKSIIEFIVFIVIFITLEFIMSKLGWIKLNIAHIAGFITGYGICMVISLSLKNKKKQ